MHKQAWQILIFDRWQVFLESGWHKFDSSASPRNLTKDLFIKIRTRTVVKLLLFLYEFLFRDCFSTPQCARTDLNKRFLPRPKTITAWKLIPHRSKISKKWNPLRWVPLHRFFKNWFLKVNKSRNVFFWQRILPKNERKHVAY